MTLARAIHRYLRVLILTGSDPPFLIASHFKLRYKYIYKIGFNVHRKRLTSKQLKTLPTVILDKNLVSLVIPVKSNKTGIPNF